MEDEVIGLQEELQGAVGQELIEPGCFPPELNSENQGEDSIKWWMQAQS